MPGRSDHRVPDAPRRSAPEDGWVLEPEDELWPALVPAEPGIAERIYGVGDPEVLSEPCVSVVGARRGTPYGIAVAKLAGRVAAECGLALVSGGALGCDSAAARAAIEAGGRVVVVGGSGADTVYPKRSRDIFEVARTDGCVVSLCPWGTPPVGWAFRKRNPLIAALSNVLLVCEAAMPSGTFSTAQAAEELGRRVYAAPGSIFSPYARGTNWLLEQGAAIIVDDVSLEMALTCDYDVARLAEQRLPEEERRARGRLMEALIAEPLRADEAAKRLGVDVVTLLQTLGDYEAEGLVVRLQDGCYAPSERALIGDWPNEG